MQKRRDFIFNSGALLLGSMALRPFQAFAAEGVKTGKAPSAAAVKEVLDSATDCLRTGEKCLAHCERELSKGNVSMANCHKRVRVMLALVRSTITLAASDSDLLVKLAALCAEACKACGEACAEHKEHFAHGMHLECKACMEACQHCEKACNKLTA